MSSQFNLLSKKKFLPFFVTQLLGAANDNIFKQALVVLLLFKVGIESGALWVNIAAGIFILPFFLFSSIAGQIADAYDKSSVIRWCKIAEIVAMGLAMVGFLLINQYILITALFLMGCTSAFFGPAKYSIMPQHLNKDELLGANALVEMGTFLSILTGTIIGGTVIMLTNGELITSFLVLLLATVGYIVSRQIPPAPSLGNNHKINFNIFKGTAGLYKETKRQRRSVSNSVLAISWFWFVGAIFLAQIPVVAKFIYAESVAVTLFLAIFSVGIGVGSLLCEKLSQGRIELGIVPLGSIGITLAVTAFAWSIGSMHDMGVSGMENTLLAIYSTYRGEFIFSLLSLFAVGFFGGLYTVPLYAIVQTRTDKKKLPTIIASNNMLNAAFMVLSAVIGMGMHAVFEGNLAYFFYCVAGFNAVVAIYIYKVVPEFFLRFCSWVISHTLYRVKYKDFNHVPNEGACIVASNHVSFMDALVVFGAVHRPVKFVMFEPIYRIPVLNLFFRAVGAIPIASKKENPEVFDAAFDKISEYLKNGEVVCIFPEGKLTSDGEVDDFKHGIRHIIERDPVPIVPIAINGLWGSMFSRKRRLKMPRPKWSSLIISSKSAIHPEDFDLKKLEGLVKEMHKENNLK